MNLFKIYALAMITMTPILSQNVQAAENKCLISAKKHTKRFDREELGFEQPELKFKQEEFTFVGDPELIFIQPELIFIQPELIFIAQPTQKAENRKLLDNYSRASDQTQITSSDVSSSFSNSSASTSAPVHSSFQATAAPARALLSSSSSSSSASAMDQANCESIRLGQERRIHAQEIRDIALDEAARRAQALKVLRDNTTGIRTASVAVIAAGLVAMRKHPKLGALAALTAAVVCYKAKDLAKTLS